MCTMREVRSRKRVVCRSANWATDASDATETRVMPAGGAVWYSRSSTFPTGSSDSSSAASGAAALPPSPAPRAGRAASSDADVATPRAVAASIRHRSDRSGVEEEREREKPRGERPAAASTGRTGTCDSPSAERIWRSREAKPWTAAASVAVVTSTRMPLHAITPRPHRERSMAQQSLRSISAWSERGRVSRITCVTRERERRSDRIWQAIPSAKPPRISCTRAGGSTTPFSSSEVPMTRWHVPCSPRTDTGRKKRRRNAGIDASSATVSYWKKPSTKSQIASSALRAAPRRAPFASQNCARNHSRVQRAGSPCLPSSSVAFARAQSSSSLVRCSLRSLQPMQEPALAISS
mmetsp:Transcript_5476/g.15920  ORF Transcript_5476/g.15920 Transcript_5476/m.15920 type:complete len:351 (+) Transcript_5476:1591-2643(+)